MTAAAPLFGESFAEVAPRLHAHGYDVVPIALRAKRPLPQDWPHYIFRPADARSFMLAGAGILTARTPAVDIDVRDEALARELEELAFKMLGAAPRRIGQPPKVLLVYRTEHPFNKITTRGYRLPGDAPDDKSHRVEILATGQQFVAYNIHVATGQPYQWNGKGDPLSVPASDLASITEAQVREYVKRCDEILARHGKPVGHLTEQHEDIQRELVRSEELAAHDVVECREAIAAIPNADLEYGDWITVVYAIKGALGEQGLADALRWSTQSSKDRPDETRRAFAAARPTNIGAGAIYHWAREAGWRPMERAQEGAQAAGERTEPTKKKLKWVDLGQMEPHLADGYIVKGLILPNTLVGIIGASGAGKSFFTIDLALHVAEGRPWRGKRVKRGLVVYAALEGPVSVERRLFAAAREGGFDMTSPLRLTPGPINMRVEEDVAALVAFIRQAEADFGMPCRAVVIDTLSRAMTGGDENSSEDMGALVAGADAVRLTTGAAVALVHHLGKDETRGARGWSGLKAALDSEIWVEKRNGMHVATATKERDLPEGEAFGFKLRVVELGLDADGDRVTTCVIEPTDEVPAAGRKPPSNQQHLLFGLREWRAEHRERESISTLEYRAAAKVIDRRRIADVTKALVRDGWLEEIPEGYRFGAAWQDERPE